MNLAAAYLRRHNETVEDWDGICGELADVISNPSDHIIYVEGDMGWKYHMAMVRKGLVHDAWCEGDALSLRQWLEEMFGINAWVVVAYDGEDIFAGLVRNFVFEKVATAA